MWDDNFYAMGFIGGHKYLTGHSHRASAPSRRNSLKVGSFKYIVDEQLVKTDPIDDPY